MGCDRSRGARGARAARYPSHEVSPGTMTAPGETLTTDLPLAPQVLDSPELWDGLGVKRRSRRA